VRGQFLQTYIFLPHIHICFEHDTNDKFKTISLLTYVFLLPGILYLKGYADFHSVSGSHFELDPRTVILNKVKL
jgi:hypothetical protein